MENLVNISEEINSELNEQFSIEHYITEKEHDLYAQEVVEVLEPLGFKSERLQSKYLHRGGSKSGNTELRIAGSILNMVRAMVISAAKSGRTESRIKFTKTDIARQILDEHGNGVSEKTIQRHINTVLVKLQRVYGLNYEIVNGRGGGFYVWTAKLQGIEENNLRLFDDHLVGKCRRKKDLLKYSAIQNKRGTKRSNLRLKAKGETLNKGVNPAMKSLATKIIGQSESGRHKGLTIPQFNRLDLSFGTKRYILAWMLTRNAPIRDALFALIKAMRKTDSMMADTHVLNPAGYVMGVVKKEFKEYNRSETLSQSKQLQLDYWGGLVTETEEVMKLYSDEMSAAFLQESLHAFKTKIEALAS